DGGTICTRTFIPVRVHDSIGVLGAVSVATALRLPGAAGADLAVIKPGQTRFGIEHRAGQREVETEVDQASQPPRVVRSGVVRTARKLFDGTVFSRRAPRQARRSVPLPRRRRGRRCTTSRTSATSSC